MFDDYSYYAQPQAQACPNDRCSVWGRIASCHGRLKTCPTTEIPRTVRTLFLIAGGRRLRLGVKRGASRDEGGHLCRNSESDHADRTATLVPSPPLDTYEYRVALNAGERVRVRGQSRTPPTPAPPHPSPLPQSAAVSVFLATCWGRGSLIRALGPCRESQC